MTKPAGPSQSGEAPERRFSAALTVGLRLVAHGVGLRHKGLRCFPVLTAALVVGAAAFQIMKPFLDQVMGREVAEPEEQGAGF